MNKIIVSHLWGMAIVIGILYYKLNSNQLLPSIFLAFLTLEVAFLTYYMKKKIYKVVAMVVWIFLYFFDFSSLLSLIQTLRDNTEIWTVTSLVHLNAFAFILIVSIESFQLILKSFHFGQFFHYLFLLMISFLASLIFCFGQVLSLDWKEIIASPIVFLSHLSGSLSFLNIPLLIVLTLLQLVVVRLLEANQ